MTVRLRRGERTLEVEISDNGAGFDATRARGGGLAGLADRIEALHGTFSASRSPARAPTTHARLPIVQQAVRV